MHTWTYRGKIHSITHTTSCYGKPQDDTLSTFNVYYIYCIGVERQYNEKEAIEGLQTTEHINAYGQ